MEDARQIPGKVEFTACRCFPVIVLPLGMSQIKAPIKVAVAVLYFVWPSLARPMNHQPRMDANRRQ
jgi:hypothetical protein